MSEPKYSRAFYEAAMAFGRVFGTPLPKMVLEIDDHDNGWHLRMNPTNVKMDCLEPFSVNVW